MSDMTRRAFGRTGLLGMAGLAAADADLLALHAEGARAGAAPSYRYIHLDVFTDQRLQGNQLFVFTQPAGLDTDTMQTMTRESNLSECTFVFPPEAAGTIIACASSPAPRRRRLPDTRRSGRRSRSRMPAS